MIPLPYSEYAHCDAKWLGAVPSDWRVERLRWMFRRKKITDRADAELLSVYRDYGVIPKASREDNFNRASDDLSAYQYVERGDLVLNKMKTWQGSIAVSEFDGIVSPAYYVARPTQPMNLRFMHHLLRSSPYISQYNLLSAGIRPNQWDLDFDDFRNILALLPPESDQAAIANFLDGETAKLDTLIAKQERLIELLQEKRQAVISHVVTKGLNPNAPMKDSGVEWIGEVPVHWTASKVKHIGSYLNGFAFKPEDWGETGVPIIRIQNLSSQDAEVNRTMRSIPERYRVRPGNILIAWSASLGVYIWDRNEDGWLNQHIFKTEVNERRVTRNYFRWLASWFIEALEKDSHGSTMQHLTWDKFGGFPVALPPHAEQERICGFLEDQCAKLASLIEGAQRSVELMQEHRAALISAAVTGKIDVRSAVQAQEVTNA